MFKVISNPVFDTLFPWETKEGLEDQIAIKKRKIGGSEAESSLYEASFLGDKVMVKELLRKGGDVNESGYGGGTALMGASRNGQAEIVELLLLNRAIINQQDENGFSALFFASNCWNGLKCVSTLLNNHAEVNLETEEGITALAFSFLRYDWHDEIPQLLMEQGAQIALERHLGPNLSLGNVRLGMPKKKTKKLSFESNPYKPIIKYNNNKVCYIEVTWLSDFKEFWLKYLFKIPYSCIKAELIQLDSTAYTEKDEHERETIISPQYRLFLSANNRLEQPPQTIGIFDTAKDAVPNLTLSRFKKEYKIDTAHEVQSLLMPKTQEAYIQYLEAIFGNRGKSDPLWCEDDLLFFFQDFMEHSGKGVDKVFAPLANGDAYLRRIKLLYELTDSRTQQGLQQNWVHRFFHTEESQMTKKDLFQSKKEGLITIGWSYVHNLKELAKATNSNLLDALNEIIEVKLLDSRLDEEDFISGGVSELMEELEDNTSNELIAVLGEAYYSIANSYNLGYYFQWPRFEQYSSVDVFEPEMQLWKHGFVCAFGEKSLSIFPA